MCRSASWPSCDRQDQAHGLRLFFSEIIRAKAWVAARASKPGVHVQRVAKFGVAKEPARSLVAPRICIEPDHYRKVAEKMRIDFQPRFAANSLGQSR